MLEEYDAVIIGSGQGGAPLSTALVAAGRRTALIEREFIGGTCINTGCTPTKTMIASAAVAHTARSAGRYGVEIDCPVRIDMTAVRRRKRAMVQMFRNGSRAAIRKGGVEIIDGAGVFTAPHEVAVKTTDSERLLTAPLVVVDVGSRPLTPPVEGLDSVPTLDSTTIMELAVLPDHLLILGGGYVGVEFAQMFARFGSKVTIVQMASALLTKEDDDVAEAVAGILREDGIDVLLAASAQRAFSTEKVIGLEIEVSGATRVLKGSHLLVATGRQPNTEDLGLDGAGIQCDSKGFIKVDERLRTTQEGVYAIGECAGTPPFTHMSYDDFRVLRTNLIQGGDRTTKDRPVPYTIFMDPQLGRIGMTERQAREEHGSFEVAKMEMSHVARALEAGNTRGFMKVLVDKRSGRLLGCAILGMEGGELMAMIQIAMMGKVPFTELRDAIFAHPTLAESVNNLFSRVGSG